MISRTAYSVISVTTPAPTVRPPSRIANRNSFSIATGVIRSIVIVTLSPGITISTPAGGQRDDDDRHRHVVPRHHHLHPRRQRHHPRHVRRPKIELRPTDVTGVVTLP